MFKKYKYDNLKFSADAIELRDLKFIRTFTVDEFKNFFRVRTIEVKKHPKGFLFFPFRSVIGIVVLNGTPKNPRISIVIDKLGVPHYILHEADGIRDFYKVGFETNSSHNINKEFDHSVTVDITKQIDYNTKILVDRSNYEIKNDHRFLLPFVQDTKFGFVNKDLEIIIPALYQFVLDDFYNEKSLVRVGETYCVGFNSKTSKSAVYLRKRYGLLKSNGELLLPMEYENITMPVLSNRIVLHSYKRGYAVIDFKGFFKVPFGKYNYIDGYDNGIARIKIEKTTNGLQESDVKWGIIDENGNEILKPIYKNIWNFYNKALQFTRVESDENIFEFHFANRQLMPNGYQKEKDSELQRNMNNYRSLQEYRESTYTEYNGSYAQDVMGYSDQDIDDAFEGDPEVYWNID